MSNTPSSGQSSEASTPHVEIHRTPDVLTFTLNNPDHGNEVTGSMFDAMLAELRSESPQPRARVLRIRARGKVFCTGRERAARDLDSVRAEVSRLIELKRLVRTSSLISVAEVQGDAFAFGMGLAIVTDFPLVADTASLRFPDIARILQLDPGAARRCKDFFLSAQSNTFEKNCSLAVEALTAGTMAALAGKK